MMLDRDEKRIKDAFHSFSTMAVDTATLERKVKESMRERKHTPRRKVVTFLAASIALMVLVAGSVSAAAGLGLFDRFITQHTPEFMEIVEPIEQSVSIDGISTNVIAAQMFGNQAIIYLSMRDISGQNRITEDTYFIMGGMFGISQMIYFDEVLDTAYFELAITTDSVQDYLDLSNILLYFNKGSDFSEPLPMELQIDADTMPVPDGFYHSLPHGVMLAPTLAGKFAELPYANGYQWISGMAIVGDYLHIQLGERIYPRSFFSGGVGHPVLTTPSGDVSAVRLYEGQNYIGTYFPYWARYSVMLHTCENLQPLDITQGGTRASYVFREYAFPVNANNIENYSLKIQGFIAPCGVEMDLGIRVHAGDSSQIRTINKTLVREDATIDSITISPLGVRFTGEMGDAVTIEEGEVFSLRTFVIDDVVLETSDGEISLGRAVTMISAWPEISFSGLARANMPIDVGAVTAVIVDGVRLEL